MSSTKGFRVGFNSFGVCFNNDDILVMVNAMSVSFIYIYMTNPTIRNKNDGRLSIRNTRRILEYRL